MMGEENNNVSSNQLSEWFISSVQKMYPAASDSVIHWLVDLRAMTDTECMCVLQGKSLSKDTGDLHMMATKTGKDCVDVIKGRAHIISSEFTKLYRKMEKERWKQVKPATMKLTCQIRSLLHECNNLIHNPPAGFVMQQQVVMQSCAKLGQYVESNVDVVGVQPERGSVMHLLTQLGTAFSSLVDTALGTLVQSMLDDVMDARSPTLVGNLLTDLVSLGLEGDHMCYIMAREGGVEALFSVVKDENLACCHSQALRVIATVCCINESIQNLEQVGGIELLSDVLSSSAKPEAVRSEAAGVVAQITSPCLDKHLATGFIDHMDDMVRSLTDLCFHASSSEVFLLGCAALANLTFMDTMACDLLLLYRTAKILIDACKTTNVDSLFAKDQVVTVLANMAAMDSCQDELLDSDALPLFVSFLHLCPPLSDYASEAETAAFEHVQQKSAIAITRLSKQKEVAVQLVNMEIIPQLMEICRFAETRDHSDAVLVACLTALRKVCEMCGAETLEMYQTHDLMQLIEPPLMESFIMCSGLDESVV